MKAAVSACLLVVGCTLGGGRGDEPPSDPPDDPPEILDGTLAPARSLFTGVEAVATDGDAKLWVIVRDDASGDAVLLSHEVRFDASDGLDRMPFGDGLP